MHINRILPHIVYAGHDAAVKDDRAIGFSYSWQALLGVDIRQPDLSRVIPHHFVFKRRRVIERRYLKVRNTLALHILSLSLLLREDLVSMPS